jgi:hypothetical protein
MMRISKRLVLPAVLALLAIVLPAQIIPVKLCCIAGEYRGTQIDNPVAGCPVPASTTFTMVITQAKGCGATLGVKIIPAEGTAKEFRATLSRGLKGCCTINATFPGESQANHVVNLSGTFCLVAGKWQGRMIYKNINTAYPCKLSGKLVVQQI